MKPRVYFGPLAQAGAVVRNLVFGPANVPQQCIVGMSDPQSEISVVLQGKDALLDVTHNNVMASARPLTIGIGFTRESNPGLARDLQPVLAFREVDGEKRLLAEIRLRFVDSLPLGQDELCLYTASKCRNYCIPRGRLWMRYFYDACRQWWSEMQSGAPALRMPMRELHCVFAFYVCPRPVVLVSVADGDRGNIFPMDLIGPVGTLHFTLALHNNSPILPLVARSRRIALSSVPVSHSSLAFELGKNHKRPFVEWENLPFVTVRSIAFGLPVPEFSPRVKELEIEIVRTLGSHTLLVGRVVKERWKENGLQLFQIHGFYQARRQHLQQVHPAAS